MTVSAAILSREYLSFTETIAPGSYVVLLGDADDSIAARRAGLHLKDSLAIFVPGPSGPSFISAFLFRKPLSEDTAIAQVMVTGTGAINIDAVRVPGIAKVPWGKIRSYRVPRPEAARAAMDQQVDGPANKEAPPPNPLGRWPTNILFVHYTFCFDTGCSVECPLPVLDRDYKGEDAPSKSVPKLANQAALLEWFRRLITPPGGECTSLGV